MFMLRDEIPTSSERAAVIAATISGCMPCGLGAGAGAAAGAAAAAAGAFSLPLRIAPIAMVRKMMQIRPKNTVPIPIRVTNRLLYSISSFYLSIWIIAKRLLNLQARMHFLRVFNGFSLLPCKAGGKSC